MIGGKRVPVLPGVCKTKTKGRGPPLSCLYLSRLDALACLQGKEREDRDVLQRAAATAIPPAATKKKRSAWKACVAVLGIAAAGVAIWMATRDNTNEPVTQPGSEMTIDLGGGVKMVMVWIPPGTFTMGSPTSEDERDSDETQHRVTLTKGSWIGKYEVTQEQWQQVMGNNPSKFRGSSNPVEQVSWNDCQEFLKKLNGIAGTRQGVFRLPTEAQWEYACRAGTTTLFHYGNDLDATVANLYGNGLKDE